MTPDQMRDASLLELFRMEAEAQKQVLDTGLLILERDPLNAGQLEACMRAAHSLKGASRIVGLDSGVQVAHAMEDLLVAAQEGLLRLLHNITQDDNPKLLLGKESGYAELANVSLIAQRYQAQPARFIALLGPRRMNYARLIPLVEACARQLNLNLNRR